MLAELRRLLNHQPFVPFTVHMADGEALRVPTVDHIAIAPTGRRIVVFDDQGVACLLSPTLMTRIIVDETAAA